MVLQQRCRRDPLSYRDDFLTQRRHFDALLAAAAERPSDPCPRLPDVASFLGAVAHRFDAPPLAPPVARLLDHAAPTMHPDSRRALVKLLALLRARAAADPAVVIPLFFRLLACNDKTLRRMLHGHIVSDVKKLHASGHPCRRQLQTFLFAMVDDRSEVLVKRCLHVLVDLFRKNIWHDPKCVNMIAKACFHPAMPVALIACKFMLDSESKDEDPDSDDDDDDDGDDDVPESAKRARDGQKAADMWKAFNMTGKKSSKKRKHMARIINRVTRRKSSVTEGPVSERKPGHPSLQAMMLLNDPQDFAERLFTDLQTRRRKESFENRLVLINLISRLVGTHELILFNFYPFLQRYLQPAQQDVTRILAYLTQACHEKVPSDVLHPILRGLADKFVSERSSPPSVAAGINTIRAICARVPLAILDEENEYKPESKQEAPLLEDLVQYKTSKDKGVVMAARSLIALYREVQPGLLHKKDRGRQGAEAVQKGQYGTAKAYGELQYATGVDGVELLAKGDSDDDSQFSDDDEEADEGGSEAAEADQEPTGGLEGGGSDTPALPPRKRKRREDAADRRGSGENKNINTCSGVAGGKPDKPEDGDAQEEGDEERESDEEQEGVEDLEGDGDQEGDEERREENSDQDIDAEEKGQGNDGKRETEGVLPSGVEGAEGESKPRIDELEILSNQDFAKIRARKAAEAIGVSVRTKNTGKAVDPNELQGPVKRERQTLAERMESVLQGREGREKFGSRKGLKKGGGSTNKKKLKTKSNSMVIHKRRSRSKKLSRREKQLAGRKRKDYK